MKCRICEQDMHERDGVDSDHHLRRSPLDPKMCFGCAQFVLQMEFFLIRATNMGSSPMGNWTEGWLREIIANPKKHL